MFGCNHILCNATINGAPNNEPASKMPDADLPSFFIKDPEFNEDSNVQPFSPRDGDDEDGDGAHLQSEAERELFKALKRKK